MKRIRRALYRFFRPRQRGRLRWNTFLIIILALAAAGYTLTESFNANREYINSTLNTNLPAVTFRSWPPGAFNLGLDLQGGTHLVYQADMTEIPQADRTSALEGARDVIERRVNLFGVSEPIVQTSESGGVHRVIVELAGVTDISEAISRIGDTPKLEFKEQNEIQDRSSELNDEQQKQLDDYNNGVREQVNTALQRALAGEDFAALVNEYSEGNTENGGEFGWIASTQETAGLVPSVQNLQPGQVAPEPYEDATALLVPKLLEVRDSDEQEVRARHLLICYKDASNCTQELSKEEARAKIEELKNQATLENFEQLVRENSTEPGAADLGGDLGYFSKGRMVPEFEEATYNMETNTISDIVETEFGFHLIHKIDQRPIKEYKIAAIVKAFQTPNDVLPPIDPWKETGLSGSQLKRAYVEQDQQTRELNVAIEFDKEGRELFSEITQRNVGKPVAIFLDGQPISTPTVQTVINTGTASITGNFSPQEAKLLTQRLNAGALPVPVTLLSQQTVGASLGAESLQKSLYAGLVGLILVMVFMLLYYRIPGAIAVMALAIYVALVLAVFKLWGVTLTLAGIAGFILSIGIAVDGNILIFERMKEELRSGKSLEAAIKDGFNRAWTSIRDGNISSLITAVILFSFSTSLIKGFALTLAIGIVLSMFSAIVVTRVLLKLAAGWKWKRYVWLFGSRKRHSKTE